MKQTLKWLHSTGLIIGLSLCLWGLGYSIRLFGNEPWYNTLERGGTAAVLLVLTSAYIVILIFRGFTKTAFPSYVTSYLVLGLSFSFWLRAMAKKFAPASDIEAKIFYVIGVVFIMLVCYCAALAAKYIYKNSRDGITTH